MANKRDAVLGATLEAARLLKQLKAREVIEQQGGRIDVFSVIVHLGVPLMFKPLEGLLGAYIPVPNPGILVTTERQLSIQRYTAAHELGHHFMGHRGSLDDDSILRRSPFDGRNYDQNEVAANSFAAMFLMPDWLFNLHATRQHWTADSLREPTTVYQMSLRVGTSYEATCRALPDPATLCRSHHGVDYAKLNKNVRGSHVSRGLAQRR
jgi:IrrE N-terminal-like domain